MLLLYQPYVRLRTIDLATANGDLFVSHGQAVAKVTSPDCKRRGEDMTSSSPPFLLDQLRSLLIAYFPFGFFTTVIVRDEGYSFE